MSAHQFGSRGDRILVWVLVSSVLVGLASSALVPGVEAVLDTIAFVVLGALAVLMPLGWVAQHAIGEWRLNRDCHRPLTDADYPTRETCMVRQVTQEEYEKIMRKRAHEDAVHRLDAGGGSPDLGVCRPVREPGAPER